MSHLFPVPFSQFTRVIVVRLSSVLKAYSDPVSFHYKSADSELEDSHVHLFKVIFLGNFCR